MSTWTRPVLNEDEQAELDALKAEVAGVWEIVGPCLDKGFYAIRIQDRGGPRKFAPSLAELRPMIVKT